MERAWGQPSSQGPSFRGKKGCGWGGGGGARQTVWRRSGHLGKRQHPEVALALALGAPKDQLPVLPHLHTRVRRLPSRGHSGRDGFCLYFFSGQTREAILRGQALDRGGGVEWRGAFSAAAAKRPHPTPHGTQAEAHFRRHRPEDSPPPGGDGGGSGVAQRTFIVLMGLRSERERMRVSERERLATTAAASRGMMQRGSRSRRVTK